MTPELYILDIILTS